MRTIRANETKDQEVERIIESLDAVSKEHLRSIIYDIVKCYAKDEDNCAVLILGTGGSTEAAIALNCDSMQAANLLLAANDFFGYLNTKDAPPKEMFN